MQVIYKIFLEMVVKMVEAVKAEDLVDLVNLVDLVESLAKVVKVEEREEKEWVEMGAHLEVVEHKNTLADYKWQHEPDFHFHDIHPHKVSMVEHANLAK